MAALRTLRLARYEVLLLAQVRRTTNITVFGFASKLSQNLEKTAGSGRCQTRATKEYLCVELIMLLRAVPD